MIIKKFIESVLVGDVSFPIVTTVEISEDGSYFVKTINGDADTERTVEIGTEDNYPLSGLTPEEVAVAVQRSLDLARAKMQTALDRQMTFHVAAKLLK